MQPSEPTTPSSAPSEPVATSDAATSDARSAQTHESSSSSLWKRLFGEHPTKDGGAEQAPKQDATTTEQPSPKTLNLTEEELDRRVQAETDRREAKRQKDAIAKAEQDRRAAIERKLDPNAPEFDPYAGAEERDRLKAEDTANQQFVGLLQGVSQQHDAATLDVIVKAIPPAELERIYKLEGAGVGLEGRKLIVAEGLKALEKHWKSEGAREAEQRLRGSPIFRKQVFAEARDTLEEPELLPASGGSGKRDFIEDIIADYRRAKGQRG